MTRRLTGDERQLWENLRRTVRALRPALEPAAVAEKTPEAETDRSPAHSAPPPGPPAPPKPHVAPPLVPLEERMRRRLARGVLEPDARIDLHGMNQERAFAALMSFLRRCQARGARLVVVITGKGRAPLDGVGVLRQSVPAWLSRPEFRDLVAGFEEAGRRQGGAGALYVRLRRRRDPRSAG